MMAGRQASFQWKSDTLKPNLKGFEPRVQKAITAATEYTATRGEAAMKRGARWTDRTSNARNGLFTQATHSPKEHRIIFGHAVPYGIWLEVRWSGRLAIILPTIRTQGAELMKLLRGLVSGGAFK
jgi:hypothetical protein